MTRDEFIALHGEELWRRLVEPLQVVYREPHANVLTHEKLLIAADWLVPGAHGMLEVQARIEALEAENARLKDTLQMEFEEGREVGADREARTLALEAALRDVLLIEGALAHGVIPMTTTAWRARIAAARDLLEPPE